MISCSLPKLLPSRLGLYQSSWKSFVNNRGKLLAPKSLSLKRVLVCPEKLKQISINITGINFATNLGKYLGVPLIQDRVSKDKLNFLIEKIQQRLSRWKTKNLSLAGRCTLIHLVISGIPTYVMQSIWLPQSTCKALNKLNRNFLWGSTTDKKKIHMVGWPKVIRPKTHDGLGIREARQANAAQLAKIGSRLTTEVTSPWMQVLRSKYMKNNSFFDCVASPSNSSTCKGIVRSMNMIKGGYGWDIENGTNVSLWFDTWEGGDPLCLLIDDIDPSEILRTVADILNPDGNWNFQQLRTHISMELQQKILQIRPTNIDAGVDKQVWKGSRNGVPTAKAFYAFISKQEDLGPSRSWNSIWRLSCPQKLRFFVWLLMHEKLLTNSYRHQIDLSDNDLCPRYNQCSETIIHTLMDCPKSMEVWDSFVLTTKQARFYSTNISAWITSNVDDGTRIGATTNLDWKHLFLSVAWHVWKGRNEEVFELNMFSPLKICRQASTYAMDLQISLTNFTAAPPDPVNGSWCKPPPGYMKLNVDGSFRDRQGTFGGILRDERGTWLWGFMGKCNVNDPLHAELLSLQVGLQALKDKGCSRVLVETNSSQATHLINVSLDVDHPHLHIILQCKNFLTHNLLCTINYISRNANACADALAKLGHTNAHLEVVWLDEAPPNVLCTIFNDNLS